jgi:demethylmenaquinone methyltransferase/2-methoxy-6-polyprenyl-1,4-benzoquinol methylase
MFADLAPSYDLCNALISFGQHLRWKRWLVELSQAGPGHRVLDCACGTGDIAFAFARAVGASGEVVGTDYCAEMLEQGIKRSAGMHVAVVFETADVTQLPYASASFDVASIGFGLRNVSDSRQALREMARVVKPGGRVMILETGQPQGAFMKPAFWFYSRCIVPLIGGFCSGNFQAYHYLHRSSRDYPWGNDFEKLARSAGCFSSIEQIRLASGAAYIYRAVVS